MKAKLDMNIKLNDCLIQMLRNHKKPILDHREMPSLLKYSLACNQSRQKCIIQWTVNGATHWLPRVDKYIAHILQCVEMCFFEVFYSDLPEKGIKEYLTCDTDW